MPFRATGARVHVEHPVGDEVGLFFLIPLAAAAVKPTIALVKASQEAKRKRESAAKAAKAAAAAPTVIAKPDPVGVPSVTGIPDQEVAKAAHMFASRADAAQPVQLSRYSWAVDGARSTAVDEARLAAQTHNVYAYVLPDDDTIYIFTAVPLVAA